MHYNSKLLLFGEYLIINSGRALAIPFEKYGGQWDYAPEQPGLQQDLPGLLAHLFDLQEKKELLAELDLDKFYKDLDKGMFFDSNIPVGYGLGSSGALCGAIYDRYADGPKITKKSVKEFPYLKKILSQIESYFHGSSSGIDPLISYINKGVVINETGGIDVLKPAVKSGVHKFFILDTNISRSTAPLVSLFLDKCKNSSYKNKIDQALRPVSNAAIENYIDNNWVGLEDDVSQISTLQYQLFQEMIPEAFRCIWREGLETNFFSLKLCGAGGGGFILGYTSYLQQCQKALKGFNWQVIK
jgi:mevalonate kinase